MKLTEGQIQSSVKEILQLQGWFVFKNHQSLGSYKGVADLYAIKDGRSIWLEIKKEKGMQSQWQLQFQREIETHGGEYYVVRSVDDLNKLKLIDVLL